MVLIVYDCNVYIVHVYMYMYIYMYMLDHVVFFPR